MNYFSKRLVCDALIQLCSDYEITSWSISRGKPEKLNCKFLETSAYVLIGPSTSWSYKWITFQKNKLAFSWTQIRTMYFQYCKYWNRIAPYCLNDIFMPFLNDYKTRSQMILDISLCSTNKGQKGISFNGPKTWNMLSSKIKAAAITASSTHRL